MKLTTLACGLGAGALVAVGAWTWDVVRHARLDLVTLHVQDAPLAEVLKRIASQTREIVVADAGLATHTGLRVHLDLDAAPLSEALARLAEQAGGFTRTTYAVHRDRGARTRLEALLRAARDPLRAGWTNLLGGPPPDLLPPPGAEPVRLPLGTTPPPGGGRRVVVEDDLVFGGPGDAEGVPRGGSPEPGGHERVIELPPGGSSPGPGPRRMRRRVVGLGTGGDDVQSFDVSPERILMEESLRPRVKDPAVLAEANPTPEYARRLARTLGGEWSVLHTLERLPFPGLPGGVGRAEREAGVETGPALPLAGGGEWTGAAGGRPVDPAGLLSRAEEEVRRRQFDRLERLSPEQRARQASERGSATVRVEKEGGRE